MKKWVYIWMAGKNANKERPTYYDYILMDEEETEEDIKFYTEEWAQEKGYWMERYELGYEFKNPPKKWVEKRLNSIERKIKSLNLEKEELNKIR